MKQFLFGLCLVVLSIMPVTADPGLRHTPVKFCSLASMAAATSLTTCAGGLPSLVNYAVICAYTQGVVWRDDGTDPTTTPGTGGQGLAAGQCLSYSGTFTAIKFIQQTAGAVLGVSMYQ